VIQNRLKSNRDKAREGKEERKRHPKEEEGEISTGKKKINFRTKMKEGS